MTSIDVLKGKLKQAEGKVEGAYGKATDNPKHELKGKLKQVEGHIQEGYGKAKEAFTKATDGKK